jgi:hypothetical protein
VNFQQWKADIERRASEVKELPRGLDLDSLLHQLVTVMERTEEIIDYHATAENFAGAYYILDGRIAFHKKEMSTLDPTSRDFDITTTTYPQAFVNLLLDVNRVTIEYLTELRAEVDAEVAARKRA